MLVEVEEVLVVLLEEALVVHPAAVSVVLAAEVASEVEELLEVGKT
jgi:hypothetical protein